MLYQALFVSFDGRRRNDIGGEGKGIKKGGKTFPLFGS